MTSKKNILITGLGGTIGKGMLEEMPEDVHVFHLGTKPLSHPRVTYCQADFTQEPEQWNMPEADIHGIIHLSQSPEYRMFPEKALNVFRVNTFSTLFLADWAVKKGVKHFVFASTGGVYPFAEYPISEEADLKIQKAGFYSGTKLCSEILLDNFHQQLFTKIIRIFFAYGPHQREGMLIPRLMKNVQEGNPLSLVGEEGLRINPIYYSDAAKAIWSMLEKEECLVTNLGGDEELSLRKIGQIMGEVLQVEPKFEVRPNESNSPQALIGDISYLKEHIYQPTVSFKEGMEQMKKLAAWSLA